MSVEINLLPWREQQRNTQMKAFWVLLGAAMGLVAMILFVLHMLYEQQILDRQAENERLQEELLVVKAQIRAIERIKQEKRQLMERILAIEALERNRSKTVRLLEEIAFAVPRALRVDSLSRDGNRVHIEGMGEASSDVAQFMRNIEQSRELADAELHLIQANEEGGNQIEFHLQATQPGLFNPLDGLGGP